MKKTIVFTGGGTAGHVFPGLSVIDELGVRGDLEILWIGSEKGIERRIVESRGIAYRAVPSGKLRRYFSIKNLLDLFRVIAGYFASRRILRQLEPVLLFSKGGFVTVPPVFAAGRLGIPVVTHESDFDPGLATRLNLRSARLLLTSFEDTARFVGERGGLETVCTGNPVRRKLLEGTAERGRELLGAAAKERILLVMGGSQGARQINELIGPIRDRLTEFCRVVHQTGSEGAVPGGIAPHCVTARDGRYRSYEFIDRELPDIFAAADMVVCRAGANTLAELSALGKPAILIPLESGSRGDQVRNARYFADRGAAVLLETPGPEELLETVRELLGDEEKRKTLAEKASRAMPSDAARRAAYEVRRILAEGS
jgi:UDP-N-acetylglucosamine--N-acetylmuramyl-(pentapeptide) pyrophosphoryl-undecaprenol N-acetylglucosamine transferase